MKDVLRPGCGASLAAARSAKGLSAADVAAKLKLTVRQVESLEAEDLAHLPSEIFLRGFVRNYARLLELDADDLLMQVDVQTTVSETITAPSEGVNLANSSLKRWLMIPLAILAVFVVFVAVLYQWLSQGEDALVTQAPISTPIPAIAAPAEAVTLPAPVPAPDAALSAPQATTPASVQPPPASSSAALPPPAVVTPVQPALKPIPPEAALTPAAEPRLADSKSGRRVLRFAADHDAWIQVVDGEGKRFSKLVRSGGEDSISGRPPFKLVVGEAAQVRLHYDGQLIDLQPFIGQKVARLTLE